MPSYQQLRNRRDWYLDRARLPATTPSAQASYIRNARECQTGMEGEKKRIDRRNARRLAGHASLMEGVLAFCDAQRHAWPSDAPAQEA